MQFVEKLYCPTEAGGTKVRSEFTISIAASCKYMVHLLSITNKNNDGISNHYRTMYIRANIMLLRFYLESEMLM